MLNNYFKKKIVGSESLKEKKKKQPQFLMWEIKTLCRMFHYITYILYKQKKRCLASSMDSYRCQGKMSSLLGFIPSAFSLCRNSRPLFYPCSKNRIQRSAVLLPKDLVYTVSRDFVLLKGLVEKHTF